MNQILNELNRIKFNNASVSIGKKKESCFCIINKGFLFRRWYVFHYERGKMENVFKFDCEDEACSFFIEKLVGSKMYCLTHSPG